jgi:hypothetical protein
MEERAKKGREIVGRVEKLAKNLAKIQKANRVFFDHSSEHGHYVEEKDNLLVEKMKIAFEKVVVEEIERLEQELAEL